MAWSSMGLLGLPQDLAERFDVWISEYWKVLDAPGQFNQKHSSQGGVTWLVN